MASRYPRSVGACTLAPFAFFAPISRHDCMSQFATVGVVGRRGSPHIADTLAVVVATLRDAGVEVVVETETGRLLPSLRSIDLAEIGNAVDLIVVVGGDGSILGVARAVAGQTVPVVGVNRGGLGFLADIAPNQVRDKLEAVLAGEFHVEERVLLRSTIVRNGEPMGQAIALNDVVVHSGSVSRMMDFSLWINGEFVYEQRSDGLIVASPTGSTAYALSAGGPIMSPGLDACVIVPMFPHTLTSRPLVVPGSAEISVFVGAEAETPKVSCDSQVDKSLQPGDEVRIVKNPDSLSLAFPNDHSFFESCRNKLDWGTRLSRPN